MGLSMLKLWLVRPANVSDCTVIVCGSHVKRVLIERLCLPCHLLFPCFFFWRGHGELFGGKEKSCRPPLSISNVPVLT